MAPKQKDKSKAKNTETQKKQTDELTEADLENVAGGASSGSLAGGTSVKKKRESET